MTQTDQPNTTHRRFSLLRSRTTGKQGTLCLAAFAATALLLISGCGGASHGITATGLSGDPSTGTTRATGTMTLSIKWPESAASTRVIPKYTQAITVQVLSGGVPVTIGVNNIDSNYTSVKPQSGTTITLSKPASPGVTTKITIIVPVGDFTTVVKAYSTIDSSNVVSGAPLATVSQVLTIAEGANADKVFSLDGAVTKLALSPDPFVQPLAAGSSPINFIVTPQDATGAAVLLDPATEIQVASSRPDCVSVVPVTSTSSLPIDPTQSSYAQVSYKLTPLRSTYNKVSGVDVGPALITATSPILSKVNPVSTDSLAVNVKPVIALGGSIFSEKTPADGNVGSGTVYQGGLAQAQVNVTGANVGDTIQIKLGSDSSSNIPFAPNAASAGYSYTIQASDIAPGKLDNSGTGTLTVPITDPAPVSGTVGHSDSYPINSVEIVQTTTIASAAITALTPKLLVTGLAATLTPQTTATIDSSPGATLPFTITLTGLKSGAGNPVYTFLYKDAAGYQPGDADSTFTKQLLASSINPAPPTLTATGTFSTTILTPPASGAAPITYVVRSGVTVTTSSGSVVAVPISGASDVLVKVTNVKVVITGINAITGSDTITALMGVSPVSYPLTATVTGFAGNNAVTWDVAPTTGSAPSTGGNTATFSAPNPGAGNTATYTVTATSSEATGKKNTFTITVTGA